MNENKTLQMFSDIGWWTKAIEKGVLKGIRKDQLIRPTGEHTRMAAAYTMRREKCEVSPPHTVQIPKDDGEFRTACVDEPMDRVVLGITNGLLFELVPEMLHSSCKSYQTGIGCGKVVTEVSHRVTETGSSGCLDWKSGFSKYLDSTPVRFIDKTFGKVEVKHGQSALVGVLRKYYHSNLYFDEDNRLQSKCQPLKQGCAVVSWLADALLCNLDREPSQMSGYCVRYSGDILFIGEDYEKVMGTLQKRLGDKSMKLNPREMEYLAADIRSKFLGFSTKGGMASLSSSRVKTFRHEIERRAIRCWDTILTKAVDTVNCYLYEGEFSWAIQVLPVCNMKNDLNELNKFAMDCFRAVQTGKCRIGGLGYIRTKPDGCIVRGQGRNMKVNRGKTDQDIPGYLTIGCMRSVLLASRVVYNTLVAPL